MAQRNVLASLSLLAYVVALTASRTPWLILAMVVLVALFRGRPGRALANPFVRWSLPSIA